MDRSTEQLNQLLKQAEDLSAEDKLWLAKCLIEQAQANTTLSKSLDEREDENFSSLEKASQSGDEADFLSQLNLIDLNSLTSRDFLKLIKLALKAGATDAARSLATKGAELYPKEVELKRYARLFSLPKIIRHYGPPDPSIKNNRDWLKANSPKYSGQWVALRNGQLLKTAHSLADLVSQIADRKGLLITQV